jgi:hypothetical protein
MIGCRQVSNIADLFVIVSRNISDGGRGGRHFNFNLLAISRTTKTSKRKLTEGLDMPVTQTEELQVFFKKLLLGSRALGTIEL